MRTMRSKLGSLLLCTLWVNHFSISYAYIGPNDLAKKPEPFTKAANCAPASAQLIMQFNDVRALIEQGGSMFQNRTALVASYEVPKGSGLHVIYAGALWMGGKDVNDQLKLAAVRFRRGNDFWPGPLTVNPNAGNYDPSGAVGDDAVRPFGEATINAEECAAYDKFFTIRKAEVVRFSTWFECENGLKSEGCNDVIAPTADELKRIYEWPAHGDKTKGQDYFLAPFYDRNGDNVYNPENDGDYPWYDDILDRDDIECGVDRRISLFGDETHWWVFNDKGNIHTETNGDPIGMEIRAQAFAFATNDEVNRMTFYNYEIINRGTQTLKDTYFSQYLDCDVGNYADDYVGCDVSRGLGYMYNGDLVDQSDGGRRGYGENPPAIGCDFFEGPYQDADKIDNVGPYYDPVKKIDVVPTVKEAIDGKGIVYKGIGIGYADGKIDNERFGMRRFTYYNLQAQFPYTDPASAVQYYNFMSGTWANGSEMFYGGMGYVGSTGVTTIPSDYMFPGDSDPLFWATAGINMVQQGFPNGWDESTNKNPVGDRRFVQSAGPFILRPGAINNITVGMVYGRGTDGDLFSSVRSMKRADTKAQALFDACFRILSPPDAPRLTIQELTNELILMIDNPGSSNNANEAYAAEDEINITDPSLDRFYRFEGYQIFQLKNDDVSVSDIYDPEKSRLVAQCDKKNGIGRIINFEFDEALGFSVPVEKVNGEDRGIRHTFRITEDEFASGDSRLINHKTYYYVAIAYAFNGMADSSALNLYNPNDPKAFEGQKMPYISSRLSFDGSSIAAVSAVPHNPLPEAQGTKQHVGYGTSPRITRLDGHGNGNRSLEFTDETLQSVLTDGYVKTPEYDFGKGPINIKVVDPLNLMKGYFECRFKGYKTGTWQNKPQGVDTSSWVIYRYDRKGGVILDSVSSEQTIEENNEQIIPEWGISIDIKQHKYIHYGKKVDSFVDFVDSSKTELIESSIAFSDSSKRWLNFVYDNDLNDFPSNWIRSGTFKPDVAKDCRPDEPAYANPCNYPDELRIDDNKEFAKIIDGGIAPHRLVGYLSDYMPLAYYRPVSMDEIRKVASISFLPSINLVITSDKSKWTRCPVIELGRDKNLNIGGAEPGALRKSANVDKDGKPDGSGTGMGWFPGYAVDVESGARLYLAFGENSFLALDNGSDMIWNPTSRYFGGITPVMGGMHPIYVFNFNQKSIHNYANGYDFPAYKPSEGENISTNHAYQLLSNIMNTNSFSAKRNFYGSLSWIAYPLLRPNQVLNSTDVTMKIRLNKEYRDYVASNENLGKPMYGWSMDDIATVTGSKDQLNEALDLINVVPNPYYAFSEYERNRLDTRVKITNLPDRCTVRIYTVNGKLVRTYKKDNPITSLDWDLNNAQGIPVAGGVYLIHVEVPGVGEKILKFFGGMRQVDLHGI